MYHYTQPERKGEWHYVGGTGPFQEWVWVDEPAEEQTASTAGIILKSSAVAAVVIGLLLVLTLNPEIIFMAMVIGVFTAGIMANAIGTKW